MANYLRTLLDLGIPQDQAENVLAQMAQGDQMPQPRYDIAPMQQNTMRVENGPDAGKVTSLDFGGGVPTPGFAQPRTLKVFGIGNNGINSQLGAEDVNGPIALDRTQAPIDIPGVGRAIRGRDGNAYVIGPDGQPVAKAILGYDRQASMQTNAYEQSRRAKEADIAQTQAQTANIGAPNYQLTPEGDVFNPKTGQVTAQGATPGRTARQQQSAAYQQGLKELSQEDAQVANTMQLEQAYKRWSELNAKTQTGRVAGMASGLTAFVSPDMQELKQLESYLAVNNFKPGQGQISNFERGLIKGAGPTVSNDQAVNDAIIKINMGGIQNMRERANFRQTFLQSKGNLLGSDAAWQKYINDNPRYVQDEAGQIVDNPKRQDWQSYFGGQSPAAPATPAAGGLTREQAIAELKRRGRI